MTLFARGSWSWVVGAVAATAATMVHAAWPERPIQVIVPYGPGGAPDIFMRMIAAELGPRLGQPVLIENRPGAGANIGTQMGYRAVPDGYTLIYTNNATLATNQFLFKEMPYDPSKLTSIRGLYKSPNLLVVPAGSPIRSVADLIAYGKSNPDKLTFGSPGIGTSSHLSGELFKSMAEVDGRHVPYRASPEAMQDVAAGNIHFIFANVGPAIPMIDAGKVRALAITSSERSKLFPNVPTMPEAGVAGYVMESWGGLSGPPGLPDAIVQRLRRELDAILEDRQVKERMDKLMFIGLSGGPKEYDQLQEAERSKWRELVKKTGALVN